MMGFDQESSSGDHERLSNSAFNLKVEPTGFAHRLGVRERKVKNDSKAFLVSAAES